ncbi:hypothetical protein EYF80_039224 [Liparis tanakae]|uniref:Uncharacterized protein n=1 Tax=Liparis tanakae TaxID=230148 RepID=A0A4Z2GD03_9TELE|nr:hypothetical protein EYF80_039224 [Liparis tanakae]
MLSLGSVSVWNTPDVLNLYMGYRQTPDASQNRTVPSSSPAARTRSHSLRGMAETWWEQVMAELWRGTRYGVWMTGQPSVCRSITTSSSSTSTTSALGSPAERQRRVRPRPAAGSLHRHWRPNGHERLQVETGKQIVHSAPGYIKYNQALLCFP